MFMARFLHLEWSDASRKFAVMILALSWCVGLYFGFLIFQNSGATISAMMSKAVYCPVSIFGALIPFLLPFLFSAFAVYLSSSRLLPVICLCKAFMFASVSCGLFAVYGSAGWLMQMLFLFSDMCYCSLLFLFWLRHISGKGRFSVNEALMFLFAAFAVAWMDYFVISPFLQGVLLN